MSIPPVADRAEGDGGTALVAEPNQKYVASTTLTNPFPWINSALLAGDAAGALAELKGP